MSTTYEVHQRISRRWVPVLFGLTLREARKRIEPWSERVRIVKVTRKVIAGKVKREND